MGFLKGGWHLKRRTREANVGSVQLSSVSNLIAETGFISSIDGHIRLQKPDVIKHLNHVTTTPLILILGQGSRNPDVYCCK